MSEQDSPGGTKTLVVGLDGGNLDVFRRMSKLGHMPFFASVLERGTSGMLRSVVPPITPGAWSTFATGKNPGKHGVIEFFTYENAAAPLRVVNSTSVKSDTLWGLLSRAGKRIGVVNVPMTYPVQPINGIMISDQLLTPSPQQNFVHPPGLLDELRPKLGQYAFAPAWREYAQHRVARFIEDMSQSAEQQGAYVCHFLKSEPWDFFMVVFSETDFLQHRAWSYLDPADHRYHSPRVEQRIHDFFRRLDDVLKAVCSTAGEGARMFFVSDHGFGPFLKWFYVNTWLAREGWLAYHPRQLLVLRAMRSLRQLTRRTGYRYWRPRRRRNIGQRTKVTSPIDWSRSQAFSVLAGEQGIRINLQGREPYGTVAPGREYEELRESIIARLRELRDPATGNQIADAVWKREKLYSGPCTEYAADIVFLCRGGEYVADVFPARRLLEPTTWYDGIGTHRMNGLLAACGPGIRRRGTVDNAELQDLLPTILYSLRQPIPNDVDGRVLSEVFEPEVLADYQPQFCELAASEATESSASYSEEEEKLVVERLRGLGYLD